MKIGKLYAQAVAAKGNNTETFQYYLRAGYALIVKRRVMLREPDIRSDDWSAWLTGNCEALGFGAWTAGLLMRAADRFQFETDFKFDESEAAAGLHWMDKQWQSSPVDVAVRGVGGVPAHQQQGGVAGRMESRLSGGFALAHEHPRRRSNYRASHTAGRDPLWAGPHRRRSGTVGKAASAELASRCSQD